MIMGKWRAQSALFALALVTGCGGGGVNSTPTPAPSPTPTPAPTPTPTPTPAPTPTPTPSASFVTSEYNRSDGPGFHNAIPAWQTGANGSGVTIAVIDSGIDSDSPEFAGRLHPSSTDLVSNRGLDNADSDHGTNVAMVAAAARDNTGIMGIAFNATIAMYRADTAGTCADPDPDKGCTFNDNVIAQGIDRAIANGAKVINLSLGGSPANSVLRAAVQRAAAAGIVVVVAAGNNGDSTDPADDPNNPDPMASSLRQVGNGNVIIAGSVTDTGTFSTFSNRAGTEANWFISALGDRVCCVYENGVLKITTDANGQRFQYVFSGTSFSAPQIAGAAALLRQAFPNLTATQVVDLLLRTARDGGASGIDTTYGRGILDIAQAFAPQGTTSLASSAEPLPLGDTSVVTSPPMGDASDQGDLAAVVLDGYGRAYQFNLAGTARAAQLPQRLTAALAGQQRSINLGAGQVALAFTVDGSGRVSALPWTGQLSLGRSDSEMARVLAARVIARVAPDRQLGFAYRQGSDGLVASLQGRHEPAFLIAGSPLDDYGMLREDETAIALRQTLGRWGVTASADRAQAVTGAPMQLLDGAVQARRREGTARFGIALDRRFGEFDAALGASWLNEDRTVLGARLHDALGSRGAQSLFLDASLAWTPDPQWRFGGALRRGFTAARSGASVAGGSRLGTMAWAFDASRTGLFQPADTLSLRFAQPLRVESGGLNLALPVAYDYATLQAEIGERFYSLSPRGRERIAELAWRGTLWDGAVSASLFYRVDPGHRASLPDDKGVALRWNRSF